jgi:triphosphoribosyl-dephospho-CoA synthase
LLAIMATLEDTCLLHRGGPKALEAAQRGAAHVLALGGCSTVEGSEALQGLHEALMALWASPGGAADMLAACLFVDGLTPFRKSSL